MHRHSTLLETQRISKATKSALHSTLSLVLVLIVIFFILRSAHQSWQLLHVVTNPKLGDQPDYTALVRSSSAQLCNPVKKCSSWTPGVYDWQALSQQGIYRDLATVNVDPGCRLNVTIQWSEQETKSLELSAFKNCQEQCRNLLAMDLTCDLTTLVTQWTNANQGQTIVINSRPIGDSVQRDITLITQFTPNRLSVFQQTLSYWSGPISIAIYLTEPNDVDTFLEFFSDPEHIAAYERTSITVVQPSFTDEDRVLYPINHLRNLAITAASSSAVFVIDADFVPSENLYQRLYWHLGDLHAYPRTALVVPSFSVKESHNGIPTTVSALQDLLRQQLAYISDPGAGHGPTLARPHVFDNVWPRASTYEVCYESQWEPYYAISRFSPLYDVRFTNQGGDKQSHALQLNAQGFHFTVVRDAFIVHKDHPKLIWPGGGFEQSQKRRRDAWGYFSGFIQRMQQLYGRHARWPFGCSAQAIGWLEQQRDLMGIAVGAV